MLRDGSQPIRPSLDYIAEWDARNDDYPVEPLTAGKTPRSYTWSVGKVLDQGPDGACVGFAFTHELIARPKVYADLDAQFAQSVYFDAQRIDTFRGGEYPGASPIMAGTSLLAGAKVLKNDGYITEYRWARNVGDLARAVGHLGPAVIGLQWFEGMDVLDDDGYIRHTGRAVGGHAICIYGVNQRGRYFKAINSWGPSWGDDGRALIDFDDMARILRSSIGQAVVPLGRKAAT